ncbi:GntR family transcriptional regulator [Pseudoclavibacter sp. AY1F1]|uniref:GntR family transcriptional regulator n=1 Tax=Pseudoclavibacter sp. AY1F1 TaxID=2080583 RepID=UPI000CE88D39|nr:GntR family transcriptional regulator [Pseudoclavibacter sp. AY1F1]PPF46759.1 GntR family transcriptional regulator [Pseudoclavibacter sp. AY1F1]
MSAGDFFEHLSIGGDSSRPPGKQLRDAIIDAVERGDLEPGERLPPVRTLAGTLGVAPGTVAKCYTTLEKQGVVVGRGRAGTFVTDDSRHGDVRLTAAARAFAVEARELGVSDDEAVAAVFEAFSISAEHHGRA